MNHDSILKKVLETYTFCEFKKFPFDCISAIRKYGYYVYTYSELKEKNPEVYELCASCSDEAYTEPFSRTVAYNEEKPLDRIIFSLAHELGHIVLEHPYKADYYEKEANCFASYVLAPSMVIHYCHCESAWDVHRHFRLSDEAAHNAFAAYRRWYRRAAHKMYPVDWAMYSYFYKSESKKFICAETECFYCGRTFYNRPGDCICPICDAKASQEPYPFNDLLSPTRIILDSLRAQSL